MTGPRSVALSVVALGLALSALAPASTAATTPAASPSAADGSHGPTVHSSDGAAGPLAEPMPRARLAGVVRSNQKSYKVVPGVRFRQFDQRDARGTIRAYLLRANLQKPGLSLQYAGLPQVAARDELTDILARRQAVAGVNGDFFDISDTGAPLGVGIDGSRVVHGPSQGWLKSFVLPAKGTAAVGDLPVEASVRRAPDLGITNVNSPRVSIDGIGVYTEQWGRAPGYTVTDGARNRDVRQVVIKDGRVVSNTTSVSAGTQIDGRILIGRGEGAVRLNRQLPLGTRARVVLRAPAEPQVAISGSAILLQDGRIRTDDDGELHPRTAVGVDTDTGRVLLLVVDGRQDHSRGYTLLELARLMKQLGAEEALNLDGGGSSTMVTTRPSGRTRVANSPSDGQERTVPNGLQLVYDAP
ncbi:MAG: Sporulation-specific_N-acetylmuramoyl-L-alanine_amidase [uncultured Nocardioidaceae bacterium]|uniref:Sporulation-specific_N-acetylmuramoyl-L-alanine_a midase n=1 Tax=uncultured Nocardioidaceae bacterium TaxID=253824 RepID=A0A6J4MZZ7_9ACTN|nr:MAG: Sporulation-specific_N-acetylmuramoyl-L-alanine_amidase [uncultured Nocardioidaceae bacterium]